MFSAVKARVARTVVAIHVADDGTFVQAGEVLMAVRPD